MSHSPADPSPSPATGQPAPGQSPRASLIVGLGLISLLALVESILTGLTSSFDPDDLVHLLWIAGGKIPSRLTADPYRLVTATFVHLSTAHRLINYVAVLLLAYGLTRRAGPRQTLLVFVVSALGSTALSAWLQPPWSGGASGAAYGLLGALLGHALINADSAQARRRAAVAGLLMAVAGVMTPRADVAAHLSGLLIGMALAPAAMLTPRLYGRVATVAALVYALVLPLAIVESRSLITRRDTGDRFTLVEGDLSFALPESFRVAQNPAPALCPNAFSDGYTIVCVGLADEDRLAIELAGLVSSPYACLHEGDGFERRGASTSPPDRVPLCVEARAADGLVWVYQELSKDRTELRYPEVLRDIRASIKRSPTAK